MASSARCSSAAHSWSPFLHAPAAHARDPRQRSGRPGPRGSRLPDRRGQRLVSRRLEEREAGPHRVRASLRAPDVRRVGAPRQGLFPSAAGSRRDVERLDQRRPHQLLGSRADQRAGAGAVDGIGSHGLPAAGADGAEIPEPARRGAQRAAAELREPPVRVRGHGDGRGALSAGASLSLADDRRSRRSARDRAR